MANTLFDHGAEYHFHDVNFTQNLATMRQTEHDSTKPSKLELLQEDYRSRLLHEREQKANALFEQKVRAELLPKKGSVRDFFLNRRMLAASTSGASNGVNLPPIKTNRRYKGKHLFLPYDQGGDLTELIPNNRQFITPGAGCSKADLHNPRLT
jgi:hypothetical protein